MQITADAGIAGGSLSGESQKGPGGLLLIFMGEGKGVCRPHRACVSNGVTTCNRDTCDECQGCFFHGERVFLCLARLHDFTNGEEIFDPFLIPRRNGASLFI
jgi:hypothetical protein